MRSNEGGSSAPLKIMQQGARHPSVSPYSPPHPHFALDVLNAIAVLRQENFVGRVSVYEAGMSEERNNAVEALATDGSPRSLAMTVTR